MEFEIQHPELNGGYECGEDSGLSLEEIMREAQKEIGKLIYEDKTDGKMKIRDVPDFAWNALSETEKKDFMNRMQTKNESSMQAWQQAGMDLAKGVQGPWNDFVQKAEDQSKADANADLDRD